MTHTFQHAVELLHAASARGVSLPLSLAVDLALEIAVQKHRPASGLYLLGGYEFHMTVARLLSNIYDLDLIYFGTAAPPEQWEVRFILKEVEQRARFRDQLLLLSSFDLYPEEIRTDIELWDHGRNRQPASTHGCVVPLYGICLPDQWQTANVRWTAVDKISAAQLTLSDRTPPPLSTPHATTTELSSVAVQLLELFVCHASREFDCAFPRARRMEQICAEAAILQSWDAAPLIPSHTLRQAFGLGFNHDRLTSSVVLSETAAKIARRNALVDHDLATTTMRELFDRTMCA